MPLCRDQCYLNICDFWNAYVIVLKIHPVMVCCPCLYSFYLLKALKVGLSYIACIHRCLVVPAHFVSSQQDIELHLWFSGSYIFSAILGYYLKRCLLCQPLCFTPWFPKAFVSNWNSLVSSRIVFLIPVRGLSLDVPEPPQHTIYSQMKLSPFSFK